jgi:hypothetical protein
MLVQQVSDCQQTRLVYPCNRRGVHCLKTIHKFYFEHHLVQHHIEKK